MKPIKQVLLVAMLIAGTTSFAQKTTGEGNMKQGLHNQTSFPMMKQLNLSDEQKTKLADLRKEQAQKDSVTFGEIRQKMQQVRSKRLNDLKSILTQEQLGQVEKMQTERIKIQGQRGMEGMRPGRSLNGQRVNAHLPQFRKGTSMGRHKGFGKNRTAGLKNEAAWNKSAGVHNGIGMNQPARMGKGQNAFRQEAGNQGPVKKNRGNMSNATRALKQTDRLYKALNLSDDQAIKILRIHERFALKDSLLVAQTGNKKDLTEAERNAIKIELQAQCDAKAKEINALLKPYQKVKHNQLVQAGPSN